MCCSACLCDCLRLCACTWVCVCEVCGARVFLSFQASTCCKVMVLGFTQSVIREVSKLECRFLIDLSVCIFEHLYALPCLFKHLFTNVSTCVYVRVRQVCGAWSLLFFHLKSPQPSKSIFLAPKIVFLGSGYSQCRDWVNFPVCLFVSVLICVGVCICDYLLLLKLSARMCISTYLWGVSCMYFSILNVSSSLKVKVLNVQKVSSLSAVSESKRQTQCPPPLHKTFQT